MRKFLRLSLLTAALTLVMSAAVWAAEEITESTTLAAGNSYTDMVINGDVTITVPKEGVSVESSGTSALANGSCITIESGNVTIEGAEDGAAIQYGGTKSCGALIRVSNGATLTLKNVVIDGNNLNTGNSNGKYFYGIDNKGTLTITDGTVVKNFTTVSYSKFGSAVYNEGTFNMTGGEICNNAFTLGGGISAYGNVNISGGTIHDNSNYSIYHNSGEVRITGGLIVGKTLGQYDVSGVYTSGPITLAASVGNTTITIVDESENGISVKAKNGDYFVANPEHNIVATIDQEPHSAIYYENSWHFINAGHDVNDGHDHQIHLDTDIAYMFVGDKKTVIATVVCSGKHYKIGDPVITGDSGVVAITRSTVEEREDQTAFELTALRPGKADIAFLTSDNAKTVLTVQVTDPNVIENEKGTPSKPKMELVPGKTYVNTKIIQTSIQDPYPDNAMVVTVPTEGIKVGSTSGVDCITIEKGAVKLTGGGTITHVNDGEHTSRALIRVKSGALLVLDNITIDGGWTTDTEATKDLLYYGIYIEKGATVIINSGTIIKGIDVNAEMEDDAILFNNGDLTINGGAIYDNDNRSYVLLNNGGTVTVNGGVTVGSMPSDQISNISGNGKWGVLGLKLNEDSPIIATYDNGKTLDIKASTGDCIMTGPNGKLTSDGKDAKYNSVTHSWDFIEALKAEVSFVRGKDTKGSTSSDFGKTHYIDKDGTKDETNADKTGDTYSVSTGFYIESENPTIEDGKAYVVFDILFPADKTVYFDTDHKVEFGGANHAMGFDLKRTTVYEDGGSALTEAKNSFYSNEKKGKYVIDAAEGETKFGVIVDGIYARDAIAYISTCTKAQYENAPKEYKEVEVSSDEEEPAVVSLELE